MQFNEWLQAVMLDEGVTQAELARRTGASTGLVSLWYWGKKKPSTPYIPKIAVAINRTDQQVLSALDGRETSAAANVDARTRAVITRLFGLPSDFSEEEAGLVRDLVFVFRRWQEKMESSEKIRTARTRGPRQVEARTDRRSGEGSR